MLGFFAYNCSALLCPNVLVVIDPVAADRYGIQNRKGIG